MLFSSWNIRYFIHSSGTMYGQLPRRVSWLFLACETWKSVEPNLSVHKRRMIFAAYTGLSKPVRYTSAKTGRSAWAYVHCQSLYLLVFMLKGHSVVWYKYWRKLSIFWLLLSESRKMVVSNVAISAPQFFFTVQYPAASYSGAPQNPISALLMEQLYAHSEINCCFGCSCPVENNTKPLVESQTCFGPS